MLGNFLYLGDRFVIWIHIYLHIIFSSCHTQRLDLNWSSCRVILSAFPISTRWVLLNLQSSHKTDWRITSLTANGLEKLSQSFLRGKDQTLRIVSLSHLCSLCWGAATWQLAPSITKAEEEESYRLQRNKSHKVRGTFTLVRVGVIGLLGCTAFVKDERRIEPK